MKITCPTCRNRIKIHKSRNITCNTKNCKQVFDYHQYFGRDGLYLLDANIFIYAKDNHPQHGPFCSSVLSMSNIATTEDVISELPHTTLLRKNFKIYKVKKISDEIKEIKSSTDKQPSHHDLSLLQASIDHPEILGIITYDYDFKNIASGGIVDKKSDYKTKFIICTAEELIKKSKQKEAKYE